MIDDSAHAHLYYSPVCAHCRHLDETTRFKCAAFPDGIPFAIWDGENPHTGPVDGDHGITFEPLVAIAEEVDDLDTSRLPRKKAKAKTKARDTYGVPGHWVTIHGRHVFITDEPNNPNRPYGIPSEHPGLKDMPDWPEGESVFDHKVPVPKGLAEAKTNADLEAWYKENYKDFKMDLDGADFETAKQTAITYNELATRYYDLGVNVSRVTVNDWMDENVYAAYENKKIYLNGKAWKDPVGLAESVRKNEANGFHPKGVTDPQSILVHEYGHAVMDAVSKDSATTTFTGYTRASSLAGQYARPPRDGTVEAAMLEYYRSSDSRAAISEYAVKGRSIDEETWAEGFVAIHYGAPASALPRVKMQRNIIEILTESRQKDLPWPVAVETLPEKKRKKAEAELDAVLRRLRDV